MHIFIYKNQLNGTNKLSDFLFNEIKKHQFKILKKAVSLLLKSIIEKNKMLRCNLLLSSSIATEDNYLKFI